MKAEQLLDVGCGIVVAVIDPHPARSAAVAGRLRAAGMIAIETAGAEAGQPMPAALAPALARLGVTAGLPDDPTLAARQPDVVAWHVAARSHPAAARESIAYGDNTLAWPRDCDRLIDRIRACHAARLASSTMARLHRQFRLAPPDGLAGALAAKRQLLPGFAIGTRPRDISAALGIAPMGDPSHETAPARPDFAHWGACRPQRSRL